MRIFRVHHKFGYEHGPFTGDYANGFFLKLNTIIHPPPNEDGIYGFGGNYACVSLKAIDVWFGQNIRVLFDHGFVVTEFEVDESEINIGYKKTQCRFFLDKSVPIRTMSVREAVMEAHGFE